MLIITQVKTTLRMKFRKENLLFGDQNYRFPQPGVTVGQQSFKGGLLVYIGNIFFPGKKIFGMILVPRGFSRQRHPGKMKNIAFV